MGLAHLVYYYRYYYYYYYYHDIPLISLSQHLEIL